MGMDNTGISRADLLTKLTECRGVACFLTEAISLILEENSVYTDDYPATGGATTCLRLLADKIQQLIEGVEGGIL